MIPHWEFRNPRFWLAVAFAVVGSCSSACGGDVGAPPEDSGADVELCPCTTCGTVVMVPCDGGAE